MKTSIERVQELAKDLRHGYPLSHAKSWVALSLRPVVLINAARSCWA